MPTPPGPASVPEIQEGGTLTLGGVQMTLLADPNGAEGAFSAKSGTAHVLGREMAWTSAEGISVYRNETGYTAAGTMDLKDSRLSLQALSYQNTAGTQSFRAGEGSQMELSAAGVAVSFQTAEDLGDLSTLEGSRLTAASSALTILGSTEETFENGTISFSKDGAVTLDGVRKAMPPSGRELLPPVFLGRESERQGRSVREKPDGELCLEAGDDGAPALSLVYRDLSLVMGVGALQVMSAGAFPELRARLDPGGKAALALPGDAGYQLVWGTTALLKVSKLFQNDTLILGGNGSVSDVTVDLTEGLSVGGFQLNGLKLTVSTENPSALTVQQLTGAGGRLTAENVQAAVSLDGIDLTSLNLLFHGGEAAENGASDEPLSRIEFHVQKFHLGADGAAALNASVALTNLKPSGGALSLTDATANLSYENGALDLLVAATGSIEYSGGMVDFSQNSFGIHFRYNRKAASAAGAVTAGQAAGSQPAGGQSAGDRAAPGAGSLGCFDVLLQSDALKVTVRAGEETLGKADLNCESLSFRDGAFTVNHAVVDFDLNAGEYVSGQGRLVLTKYTVGGNAGGAADNSLMFYWREPKLLGESLGAEIQITTRPNEGLTFEVTASEAFSHEIGPFSFQLEDAKFMINLKAGAGSFGLSGGTATISTKDESTTLTADIESATTVGDTILQGIQLENATVSSWAKEYLGVEGMKLTVGTLTLKESLQGIQIERVGVSLGTDISIFGNEGLKLKEIQAEALISAGDQFAFDGIALTGAVEYTGKSGIVESVGGKLTVEVSRQQSGPLGLRISKVSDLKVVVCGYGEASIGDIHFDADGKTLIMENVAFQNLKASGDQGPVPDKVDREATGLLKKLVALAPSVNFMAEEIRYGAGGFQVDPEKIKLNIIETTISLGEYGNLTLGYREGSGFKAMLQGHYAYPEGWKADNKVPMGNLLSIKVGYYILPPVVSLAGGPFLDFGMEFDGEGGAELEGKAFRGSLRADFSAALAAGLSCGLNVAVPGFKAGLSVEGSAVATVKGGIDGGIGILFNKSATELVNMFQLEKDRKKTYFNFNAGASLGFDVNLRAEAGTKIPSIFIPANKTLVKSWNLFHYDVGHVGLKGSLFYDQGGLKVDCTKEVVFNRPGAFNFQDAMVKLEELSTSVTEINENNEEICRQLETYADAWGLGEVRDTLRLKQSLVLLNMIRENMSKSTSSYTQAYDMMKEFRSNGVAKVERQNSKLNISRDFYKAMEVFGLPPEWADKEWKDSYAAQELEPNDEQKDRLARLDPVALFYVFAGGRGGKGRGDLKKEAQKLSAQQWGRLEVAAQDEKKKKKGGAKARRPNSEQEQLDRVETSMRNHLDEIQKMVDAQIKLHAKASEKLVKKSAELDEKEIQQQELNQQDMALVAQIDELQQSAGEENREKLMELYRQREKLWKKIIDLSGKRGELRREVEDARNEVQEAITKSEVVSPGGEKRKLLSEFSAQRNAIAAAQANLENQQKLDQQFYDQIQRRYQRGDDYYQATITIVEGGKKTPPVKQTVLEANREYIAKLVEWRKGTKQADIVNNPIAEGRKLEEILENQQTAVDTVKGIDTAYQTSLKLYETLIRQSFRNEDYMNQDKVQQQNDLLSTGCAAIKELQKKSPNPETLNKLVANL